MKKFIKKVYKKVMQFDSYADKYKQITNNIELPAIAYTNWGMHLADNKDYKSAIEKLETAMIMHGKNPKPCISLGVIYAKLKEYDKAINVLKEAINRDSQNAYAYSVLSSIYVAEDKFTEAENALKIGLRLAPSDSELYLNYGIFYAKMQKKSKAIEMFKKSKFYNPINLHTLFLLGVMYFETERITEAYNEFKQIENINPQYKKLNYYIALCNQKEGNYSAIIEYAKKALDEEPDNPAIYVLLAHTYVNLNMKDEVLNIYKLGETRNITNFEFYLTEGIVYTNYNDIEKAKECLINALKLDELNTDALYRMSVCLRKEGNIQEAINYCNKALETNSNNAYALADLGIMKYNLGEYSSAVNVLSKAVNNSGDKNYLYFYIANCYYKLGRLKKSLEFYEKMNEYYPEHIETLINCTICLLCMDNAKEALRKIRNAYQIDRTSTKVILVYALTDLKCGIYSDVMEKTDMLLKTEENNQGAKLIQIQALINTNQVEKAIEMLNSVNENTKNTEMYIYLSYLAYKTLVEENTSDYNVDMLNLYSEKMNGINSETMNKTGLISYITKQ